jgi:3-deoxy-manno-octulosonate cytidylyltransferase (CMP-KDO synthetase)
MATPEKVLCVIPARYGSTRLPGKPLRAINGLPLVMWVYARAERARCFDTVVVATDDRRIRDAVERHGGAAVMTSPRHKSGTDRVFEAARRMKEKYGYIVNLQGDEPGIPAELLRQFTSALFQIDNNSLLTVVSHATIRHVENPDMVKAVLDADGKALYFSRSDIPYDRRKRGSRRFLRHTGIYGFTLEGLKRYCAFPEGILERREGLEQLRALEFGMTVRCLIYDFESSGIDTPRDLAAFRRSRKARS